MTMGLFWAACLSEASRLRLVTCFIGRPATSRAGGLRPEGERTSPSTSTHLRGTPEPPVRVGNDAWRQHQLDVPGEVVSAVWRLRDYLGDQFEQELREMVLGLTEQVAATWQLADHGMWETRDRERHYLSSKVHCWVTLNRAVELAPRLGERADPRRWAAIRDEIRATILDLGWNEQIGAYTGAFGSPALDASALLLPLLHFLPATDPRMRATIEVIERELCTPDGLVRRWSTDPAGFLLCSFWLVECLVMAGDGTGAGISREGVGHGNDVGLLAEQIDLPPRPVGQHPQALSTSA
jgi:GH15 family glucan-1,4-alpha-glucosidase